MVQLQSSWDIAHSSGESHTLVRVRNLQTTLPIGTDAWGRANKPQPVLISASISLSAPFNSASSTDSVTNSTVHYGILSKAILEACKEFETLLAGAGTWEGDGNGNGRKVPMHLRALVHFIHFYLTGQETLPNILRDSVSTAVQVEGDKSEAIPLPVLKGQKMRMLEITVMLPKASLLGSGVSLKGAFSYDWTQDEGPSGYSMALTLHELRIPTLIGVNPNERLAKQMVVASVEMDRYDRMVDAYCELEELVVKVRNRLPFINYSSTSAYAHTCSNRQLKRPPSKHSRHLPQNSAPTL
jgi:dihydroneopterin aldolase